MFDIKKKALFDTVGELWELLAELPDVTEITICGSSVNYFHLTLDGKAVCLDSEELTECYDPD